MAKKSKKTVPVQIEEPVFEVTEYDQYLFGMGTHYQIYNKLV